MRFLASLIAGVLLLPLPAFAGPCDAHFKFDGDLADAGGNGLSGQFVDSKGEPIIAVGEFVPGRTGQALRLNGETTVFSELNLQTETCPQVSVTAWIFLEGYPKNAHTLLSTGHGRGPHMAVSSSNLNAWGGSNEIRAGLAVRPGIWIFVAGVWDYTADVHRLYWRHRSMEEPLGENARPPQEGLWIGAYAYGSTMMSRANGILIDDLQVYGKALSEEEINAIRDAELMLERGAKCDCGGTPAAGQSSVTRDPLSFPSCSSDNDCPGASGFSGACYSLGGVRAQCYQRCDIDSDCGEGNVCLSVTLPGGTLDGVCTISNSPLPSTGQSSAGTGSDQRAPAPMAGTVFATGPGQQSDAVTDALAEHVNENRPPDITYDSEEEGIAAAEAAEARRETARKDNQAEAEDSARNDNGVLRATGPATVPGVVTGFSGYNQRPLDLEDRFIRAISWYEERDHPCRITIAASDDDVIGWEKPKVVHLQLGCDSMGDPAGVDFDQAKVLLKKLQVCNNNRTNRRMKGLRIFGEQVRPDGTATEITVVDTKEHPHCTTWSRAIQCPAGQYVTGIVIHSNEGSGKREQIVGLQLICRRVAQ